MLCLRKSYKLEGEGAWMAKGQINKSIGAFRPFGVNYCVPNFHIRILKFLRIRKDLCA